MSNTSYCLKCKAQTENVDATYQMSGAKAVMKSTCKGCGGKKTTFVKAGMISAASKDQKVKKAEAELKEKKPKKLSKAVEPEPVEEEDAPIEMQDLSKTPKKVRPSKRVKQESQ